MQKLKLLKEKRITGLYIFCNHCKKFYSDDTKIKKGCTELVYKAKIHVPGKDSECRTQVLYVDNLKQAIKATIEFEEWLKKNGYPRSNRSSKKTNSAEIGHKRNSLKVMSKEFLLIECIAEYLSFLNNDNVPYHEQKVRSTKQIKEYERNCRYLILALKEKNIGTETLTFHDVNSSEAVGHVCEYLRVSKKSRPKTFNKAISGLTQFYEFIIEKHKLGVANEFKKVTRMKVVIKIKSISLKEFTSLLNIVNVDNGKFIVKGKKPGWVVNRNWYKPWLKNAYLLGYFTGARREEVVTIKWSDLKYDEGELSHIDVLHLKENRSHGNLLAEEDHEFKPVLITDEFKDFLIELGYESKKNSKEYILIPEDKMERTRIMEYISNSFSHYFKFLFPEDTRTFKHLRKTYITKLNIEYPGIAHLLAGHKGSAVERKHYIDNLMLIREARRIMKEKRNKEGDK